MTVELILHELVIDRQAAKFKRAVDRREQFFPFVRFADKVVCAELHRLDRRFDVGEVRQHEDDGRRMLFADVLEHLDPADAGHLYIKKNDVERLGLEDVDRFGAVVCNGDVVLLNFREFFFEKKHNALFIIDYKDIVSASHGNARGKGRSEGTAGIIRW